MDKSLFTGNVIVQGITGTHGAFHARQMLDAGTKIVAGTSPNKTRTEIHGVPVYQKISDIKLDHVVDISVIFVPAPHAKSAMIEAIDAGVPLIVCITEGIPVHDMIAVKKHASKKGSRIIGPNCPGVTLPGMTKLGIIPEIFTLPGSAAIVSRSGTLTYEISASLSGFGIGQKYIIGIGGDRIRGTDFIDCLELFQKDPGVDCIILVGEIGGSSEQLAASYIFEHVTKPVYAYIAGHSAPADVQLGHAGAIMGGAGDNAEAKSLALQTAGAHVASSVSQLVAKIKSAN